MEAHLGKGGHAFLNSRSRDPAVLGTRDCGNAKFPQERGNRKRENLGTRIFAFLGSDGHPRPPSHPLFATKRRYSYTPPHQIGQSVNLFPRPPLRHAGSRKQTAGNRQLASDNRQQAAGSKKQQATVCCLTSEV